VVLKKLLGDVYWNSLGEALNHSNSPGAKSVLFSKMVTA
jgi:hypothetical protein